MGAVGSNRVKFNLKNVHYAMKTVDSEGLTDYKMPRSIPGAVSLSLEANGEPENFYADGVAYYVINNNMGYEGDLELALIPDEFRQAALSETLDDNNVLIENSNAELNAFALMFEFDGDARHIRHVLYNCSASRPALEGKTNEESREVQIEKLTIKATPLEDGLVKAKTGDDTDPTVYENWYDKVYLPGTDMSGDDDELDEEG
jgi:phi13 family phage major tail protein